MAKPGKTRTPARKPGKDAPADNPPAPAKLASGRYSLHSGRNIIPRETIAGQALAVVIAIMAFLACLTVGAVTMIQQTAESWRADISREVTIQIRPFDEVEMEQAIREASRLVLEFDGIARVTALDRDDSAKLLEPWLGSGLDLAELPVPRLLKVTAHDGANPDYQAIRRALEARVPGTSLDDHRAWTGRLSAMSWTMVAIGLCVLFLVLSATVLTVVFATRGAMAGNRTVVDILHYVGADRRFIARQFERHFLVLALRGAAFGGISAAIVYIAFGLWADYYSVSPQADQLAIMFGRFRIGWQGYLGIAMIILLIAGLAAGTSRITVLRQVGLLERYGRDAG